MNIQHCDPVPPRTAHKYLSMEDWRVAIADVFIQLHLLYRLRYLWMLGHKRQMSTPAEENKAMIYQIYCQNRKKPTYPYLTGFHAQIEKANL